MERDAAVMTIGFLITFSSLLPPFLHLLRLSFEKRGFSFEKVEGPLLPDVTIIIPARNESNLIVEKLEEIFEQDYPLEKISLILIDSGSTDDTRSKSERHLERYFTTDWRIIGLEKPGKTLAINHSISLIETEYFIVTDVDSIQKKDSYVKLVSALVQDSRIGAVCGSMDSHSATKFKQYRSIFNYQRIKESVIDSTPIFEGSICGFRLSSIFPSKLNEDINADDTQLAVICRRNGYRSIMLPDVVFEERDIPANGEKNRMVRRAQGLVRVFIANLDLLVGRKKYSRIFAQNFYFYIVMPWLLLLGLLIFIPSFVFYYANNGNVLISLSSIFILYWNKTAYSIFQGSMILIRSQLLLLFGKKLNVWTPHRN